MACSGTTYTVSQMLDMAKHAGYTDTGAVEIVAHALVESGGCDSSKNQSSGAAGILQFIPSTSSRIGLGNPYDAQASFDASYRLTHGSNFSDWTPYEPAAAYSSALDKVRSQSGSSVQSTGTGLLMGTKTDSSGVSQSIVDSVGGVGGTLRGIGQHVVDWSTMLMGIGIILVSVGILAYVFLTRTNTGRKVVSTTREAVTVAAVAA